MSNVLTKSLVLSQPKAGQSGEVPVIVLPHTTVTEDSHTVIRVEIPGVDPATVGVNCENGMLVVSCERGETSIALDPTVDTAKIEAEVLWGVLTLRVPLPKPPVSRHISIKTLDAPKKTAPAKHKEEEFTAAE
jgi:HSP20 family molecular chaperone IbpA